MSNTDPRNQWLAGCGPIHHGEETRQRIEGLAAELLGSGRLADESAFYAMLAAADRLTG